MAHLTSEHRPSHVSASPVAQTVLTPQQVDALRRVQAQAEQRVELGKRLFLAAEAQTSRYQQLLTQIHAERDALRQQMQQEMQATLQSVGQTTASAEDRVTQAIDRLDRRVEQLESQWLASAAQMQAMLDQAQAAVTQAQQMLAAGADACCSTAAAPLEEDVR